MSSLMRGNDAYLRVIMQVTFHDSIYESYAVEFWSITDPCPLLHRMMVLLGLRAHQLKD